MRRTLIGLAIALSGCWNEGSPPATPPPTAKIRETSTLTNRGKDDVTRIWLIEKGPDGHDRVIYCDKELLCPGCAPAGMSPTLCVRWPR